MKVAIFAACTWLLVGSAFGQAEFQPVTPGPYVSGLGGWIGIGSLKTTNSQESGRTKFDPGYDLRGALGYDFGLVRVEAELGCLKSNLDKQVVNRVRTSLDGHLSTGTIMANGYFDFRGPRVPLVPYFMAGLGMGVFELKSSGTLMGVAAMQKHDDAPMGQVGVGAALIFDKHWALDVRYLYLASLKNLHLDDNDMEYFSTSILAGVRYSF